MLAISSNELVLMFIAFEIISVSLYFIVGILGGSPYRSELV